MAEVKSTRSPVADLGVQIHGLHAVDALLAGLSALAEKQSLGEILWICRLARERLDVVSNNLDLIDIGQGGEVQHG